MRLNVYDVVADLEANYGLTLDEETRREVVSMLMRCYNDGVRDTAIESA